ncbi:hypothetical protein [Paenibacillus sp. NEAU-GSW1]|uniref:OmpL47-type beta-barrel domain-containing protein n=1 Tax=Paenibacillus sp. NEAU-GSW1 TaxID=2682486 RepID=UPI0012E165EF|nr:hypothetical protein [Paenibacillus sp. NEAU-GSW1]MUT64729.1 hypothetical protein [Paenibacillus sp. NEAU-GSW1]
MKKRISKSFSLLVSLLLLTQVLLLPVGSVFAAETDNAILPPSNLSYQSVTPTDIKLTWSAVFGATGYTVYEITDGQLIARGTPSTNSFTINSLPEGQYTYVVSTLSPNGESGPCAPITVNIAYPVMAAPALTNSVINGNDIVLSWTASQYAQNYNLYQVQPDGQKTLIKTQTARTYTVTNAPEGNYTYSVSASNSVFGESPLSNPVEVNIVIPTMAAPGNATFTVSNATNVTLKWNAVSYAANYRVYQIVDGQKVLKSTVTGTTVTYTNQPAGENIFEIYSYSDRFGESPEGSQLTVTIGSVTMTAPENLTYKVQNANDIVLTWSPVTYANSYKIYQVIDGQSVLKSTVTGTAVTYANQPAGDYIYEVRSYSDRFGESSEGAQANLTLEAVTLAPPANLAYKLQNANDVVLTWTAAANANSYKIYQVINGQKVLKSTVTGTTATYTNQPAGEYIYEVHSVSSRFGESIEGSQVSFPLVHPTMEPPANLVQTIKNATDFSLAWDASAYATSYKVYQIVNGQKVLKSTVTGLTVAYTGMSPGEYTYEVHSVSTRFGESAQGTLLTMTLNGQTMQAPANPTYSIANGNDITLKWTAVPYATSYKIYQLVDGQKVLKSTATGTAVTYTNQPEGQYNYEIHSVSSILGESPEGAEINFALDFPTVAAPGNFAYRIQNGNDIVLTWTAVTYANSYRVYELVDGQKVLMSSVTTLSSTQTNVKSGEHTYIVNAVSNRFGESTEGSQLTLTLDNTDMQPPANFTKSVANGNDLTLKWNAVAYATAYKLYQLVDGQEVLVKTQTGTTVTFTNMPEGDYSYVVRSYSDRFGESAGSELSFTLVFPIMQTPGGFIKTISNGNDITLKWNAVAYDTAYNLYQVVDGEEVLVKTQAGTTVTFTNLPEGDYSYVVRSYSNRFGESPEGAELQFTLDWPVMQAPGNLTKTVANGNDITLKWNAATYATAYRVYQVVDGQKVLKSTVTGTTATYVNMPAGDYGYVVHSYSSRFGESPIGAAADFELVWPVVQPPVVTGTVFNANNITLTWPSVAWANEYRVYDVTSGNRQLIYTGTALSFKVYNLSEKVHSFEVTAYSTRFGESASSNRVTENIVFPIMEPPVAAIKLLSDTSARISWNFVTYANGYNVYEIVDGQPVLLAENVNNLSFTVSDLSYSDHEYYVSSYSNSFGESSPSNIVIAKLIVDTEAPVTIAENTLAGWTNLSQIVTLSATDNETGVAGTFYSLNGGEYAAGTSVAVDQEGVNKVSFYSVDKVGNKETAHTIEVKIDKTAPVTTSIALEGWNQNEATVKLTATDTLSGTAKTYYAIDASDYREGSTITVSSDGVHQIRFYSMDQAGNKEAEHTIEVKVDGTAPVTASNVPSTWSKEDVAVTLTATDAQSGVAKTYYSVDGAPYIEGASFTVRNEGIHQIAFYSVDKEGNIETVNTAVVKIDKSAPVVTMDLNEEVKAGTALKLTYTATDKLSGVAYEKMTVLGPDSTTETTVANGGEWVANKPGIYTVTVTVTDAAGHTTTLKKQFAVFLQASITVTPIVIKGNKGVFTVRVDLPNGYDTQGFDLDSATLNGVKALNSNNGYYNQAKLGQFKFERSDFNWTGSEVTLHFRGYVNGILVVGQTTVKIQK